MPYYFFAGGLGGCGCCTGGCGAGRGVVAGFLIRSLNILPSPAADVTLTPVKIIKAYTYFI
jgi:hypothetical protein